MTKTYKIIDILHTGHNGAKGERKVGEKYDNRRGRIVKVDTKDPYYRTSFGGLIFEGVNCSGLYTTEFVKEYDENGFYYIETMNSIYEMEEIVK